ncbi:hypothetical protein [Paenibacillus sambharensis]|nr:hypothetical protein [Paenibacillus sambharensis]
MSLSRFLLEAALFIFRKVRLINDRAGVFAASSKPESLKQPQVVPLLP